MERSRPTLGVLELWERMKTVDGTEDIQEIAVHMLDYSVIVMAAIVLQLLAAKALEQFTGLQPPTQLLIWSQLVVALVIVGGIVSLLVLDVREPRRTL